MARVNANQATKNPATESASGPPAGFQKGGKEDIHGWYQPEVGNIVYGQIVQHIVTKSKFGARDNVLVRLEQDCQAYKGEKKGEKKGESTKVVLQPGQVIAVPITYDLMEALEYVTNKGQIWFHAIEKKEVGKNTMWKYEQFYKGIKAPLNNSGVSINSEDEPF